MHKIKSKKKAMVRNLQELKNEQNELRSVVIEAYKKSNSSILQLSRLIGIPYTTLRSFLISDSIGYKNTFKIKAWIGE
jgi:hypothetical protein